MATAESWICDSSGKRADMSAQTARTAAVKSKPLARRAIRRQLLLRGAAGGRSVVERGLLAALDDAVANAHEFQNGPGAGIAQPRLGQPHDAGVAARTVHEPRRYRGE